MLSEDKKLLRIENRKDITDMYDLDGIIEETPTTISTYKQYLCIGCLGGFSYISNMVNPEDMYVQPRPPYCGLGAAEETEMKEYPDTIIIKMDYNYVFAVYSDKTMVVMQDETKMTNRIDHIVQNHAKAIHNIEVIPHECNERGFSFVTGSSDKTIRKWYIDTQKENMHGTQTRIGLLCDEFSHWMKNKVNKAEDDISEELGQVRTFKIAKVDSEEVIYCGDLSGYVWIFDAKTFTLKTISELHEDEIIELATFKAKDFYDPRNNLVVTCSRDNKVKSFKYSNGEIIEGNEFDSSSLPVIGLGFIQEDSQTVKLVYVDAKSDLSLRTIKENLTFDSPVVKNMAPKKFFSLAVRENKIAIGTDTKIQFGELKSNNYWALMKSAGGSQSNMKEFIKLEIDETNTYVLCSSWKSNDVHCIDMQNTRVMASFCSGEPVISMKISPDYKHLITTTSKGCFYVWKLPKEIYSTMKFKSKQNELMNRHPSLNNTGLTNIDEGEEGSDNEIENDIDEGSAQDIKRKEWSKKRGSQYPPKLEPIQHLEKQRSHNVRDDSPILEEAKLEKSINSMLRDDSDNEEGFEMSMVETPHVGNEENIKAKFEFADLVPKMKRRESSYIRRDSRIGLLINKSNNIKQAEPGFDERKYNSNIEGVKYDGSSEYRISVNNPSIPFDSKHYYHLIL